MKHFKNYLIVMIGITLLFSCKNDKSGETLEDNQTSKSKNETSALKGTPATDISDVFQFRKDQFVPEHNNAYHLRSKAAFTIYIDGTEDPSTINFDEFDVIALFHERTDREIHFKVESFDNSGSDTKIEVSTIDTGNKLSEPYRPSFLIKIPKSEVKGRPVVRLNGVIAPVTTAE
ncbi:MAG: hypothetical protein IPM26_02975 [Saprospiraceae bacterium]|nr:hypothetical protein [Saprospiraceae bacterium]